MAPPLSEALLWSFASGKGAPVADIEGVVLVESGSDQ